MQTFENKRRLWKLPVIITAAGLLVFLVILAAGRLDLKSGYKVTQDARIYAFSKLSGFGYFISEIKKVSSLIKENSDLKEENKKLLSQIALSYEFAEENEFLKEALGLSNIKKNRITDARSFNMQFTPEGHYILINKGRDAGISNGDIVISSSGVLIGQIVDVGDIFSKVAMTTNSDSKITVKVLRNKTAGIARGALNNGLSVDFISQEDDIAEGDVIVTTGNDIFPPGLIVGSVSYLGLDDSNIFRKVTVKAEFKDMDINRLFILTN